MKTGYIKLWRKIVDNPVFSNAGILKVWVWCLCNAAYKREEVMVGSHLVVLEPGQLIFKRTQASRDLGINESNLYRHLKFLEVNNYLNIKTTNRYSLLSITYWDEYQASEQQNEQLENNKRTTENPFPNIYIDSSKGSKKKKEKKEEYASIIVKWNIFADKHDLPNIQTIAPRSTRERHLKARGREGLDFDVLLAKIEEQPFLTGDNKEGWTITFDWILKPSNYVKIMEEQYKKKRLSSMDRARKWAEEE